VRVASPALGIAFASLPAPFALAVDEGDPFELVTGDGGRLAALVTEGAVNLVEEARRAQREFESLPGGTFAGGNELGTPYGTASTVRGSYDERGARVEERRVFLLHPDGSGRLLTLRFTYPAGDAETARDRLRQTIDLLSELEPL
jgi:hypothetical protein